MQDANRSLQTGELTRDGAKAYVDSKQGQILQHLWKINVADIEKTLTKVVDKVGRQSWASACMRWGTHHILCIHVLTVS